MKNNKIINICIIITIFCFLLVSLSACSREDSIEKEVGGNRFVEVGDEYYINSKKGVIVYDSKTEIVYVAMIGYYRSSGGISPLYNSDGEVMKISEYYETR